MFTSRSVREGACLSVLFTCFLSMTAADATDFEVIAPNDGAVEIDGDQFTARLSDDGCSSGFDAACTGTRQRAEYLPAAIYGHGDQVAYRWEINVSEAMTFNAVDSHLYATRFLTGGDTSVLQFYLGTDYGYEVNRKTCFGPEEFGEWHQVEVRVSWDSTPKQNLRDKTPGEIHIACDGEEIFSSSGRPNIKAEDEIRLALGLEGALNLADGDNVSVSFRNLEVENW